jgi:predicted flavoprotein YhiN
MSGGGRCNFTNYTVEAENFLSENAHFCKSALSRFTQWDFLAMIHAHNIPYHEREHGQLFCNESARDILNMLLAECDKVGVEIRLNSEIKSITQPANRGYYDDICKTTGPLKPRCVNNKFSVKLCRALLIVQGNAKPDKAVR